MYLAVTIASLVFTFSTNAFGTTKPALKQIICTETSGNESDGEDEEQAKLGPVGVYTISMDQKGRVTEIRMVRRETPDLKAIDLTLTAQHAVFKHDVRANDKHLAETWGIKTIEAVEAKTKTGDRFLVRINDHSYAGPVGSTVLFGLGGKPLRADSNTMTNCQGPLKFPAPNPLEGLDFQK